MKLQELDNRLRSLAVYDVRPARAQRTRARCEARLARTAARKGHRAQPLTTAIRWLEPVAALGAGVLYLVSAVRAGMLLLRL